MAQGGKGGTTGGGIQPTPLVSLPRGPNGQVVTPTAATTGNAGVAKPQAPTGYSTNPMNNSALGFQQAFQSLQQAGGAMAPTFSGYGPVTAVAQPQDAVAYQAYTQQSPDTIAFQMDRYQNPYENQVVQNTARQMQDALQQAQMRNADAAIAAGAFGGGRHGVVEGVTNAQGIQNIGDMTAALRAQGFETAARLAGQDIANRMQVGALNQDAINTQRNYNAGAQNNMRQFNATLQNQNSQFNANAHNRAREFNATGRYGAQQDYIANKMGLASQLGNLSQASYGVGRSIAGDQMNSGNMTQQLMQQIMQGGQAGFDQMTGQAQQLLQMRLAALGMNPLNNATTTTQNQQSNPGWGATFGNLLGAAGNMFQFNPITLPWGRG